MNLKLFPIINTSNKRILYFFYTYYIIIKFLSIEWVLYLPLSQVLMPASRLRDSLCTLLLNNLLLLLLFWNSFVNETK